MSRNIRDFENFKDVKSDTTAKKRKLKETITDGAKTLLRTIFWSTLTIAAEAAVVWYLLNRFDVLQVDYVRTLVVFLSLRIVLRTSARGSN